MQTLDLRKLLKPYYTAGADPALLTVPDFSYLMIDGAGNPNTAPQYGAALQALYSLAYTLKFSIKKTQQVDYPVMALEGLWWADDMESFVQGNKDHWYWTMMILQPDLVTPEIFETARVEVERKKPGLPHAAIRLERFEEGRCAQVMHIGPYADEGPNIIRLHEFIAQHGLQRSGKHHEIYLGDPNRTAPAKLRTIIRQPVA